MRGTPIPIANGFYKFDELPLSAQECVNLYPVFTELQGTLTRQALIMTPGIKTFASISGAGRGWIMHKGVLYAVIGSKLHSISSTGVVTILGDIAGMGSRSLLAENGEVIIIITPGNSSAYFYDTDTGLELITSSAFISFGPVTGVVYKDGYFVLTTAKEIFLSSLVTENKGRNFIASSFTTAEVSTDDILRPLTINNELLIVGKNTTEYFQNIGGTGFPFARITGAHIDRGSCSRFACLEFGDSYVFLGGGKDEKVSIYRGIPGSAQRISTRAIDQKIQSYSSTELEEVKAFTFAMDGGFFVGFSFPDTTFIYDLLATSISGSPKWHERKTNDSKWHVDDAINAYGKTLVMDFAGNGIGEFDTSLATEYGNSVTRSFSTGYFHDNGGRFTNHFAQLHSESGVGDTATPEPTVTLSLSDNGGRSFQNMGERKLGGSGVFNTQMIWTRLGQSEYSRMYKFEMTDPVKANFFNLTVGVSGE